MSFMKSGAVCLVVVAASACASNPVLPGLSGGDGANYAVNSKFSGELSRRDVNALAPVFVDAMENGAVGDKFEWRGSNAAGAVTPGPQGAGNLLADPWALMPFRPGLKLSRRFETELGEFVLTRNSNVRYGPSTDEKVAEILPSGTGVEVVGKTVDGPWMLVAVDGVISGFVYEDLMVRRPGTELELAGGPTRRPHLCRPFDQSMRINGRTDNWSGVACDKGEGWVLRAPDANAPTRLF